MLENIFYINLAERVDRKEHIEKELKNMGWKVTRVDAIQHEDGRLGCSMSHLKVLEMAKEKGLDHVVVLEDDARFTDPLLLKSLLKEFFEMNLEYDVLMLAGSIYRPARSITKITKPIKHIKNNVWQVYNSFCGVAYIVNNNYYDTLIDNIKKGISLLRKYPDDNLYALDSYWYLLQSRDTWYILRPRTITQIVGRSNIRDNIINADSALLDTDMKYIPKKYTLSLTLIVKNEEKHISRVLEHAHIFADEIVIVDTGSQDNTKNEAKKFTNKIYDFEWCDNFSKARNFGIEKCTKDFVMWLDADDLISEENAYKIKEIFSNEINWDRLLIPYHAHFYPNGKVKLSTRRTRIFRNNGKFSFCYPIHESIISNYNDIREINTDISVKHANIHRTESSRERNLRILEKILSSDKYKNDFHILWHYAKELPAEKSLDVYEKLISMKYPNKNKSIICIELARNYIKLKRYNEAISTLGRAISFYPLRKEPFFELGKLYYEVNRYKESLQMFLICENMTVSKEDMRDYSLYEGERCYDWISVSYANTKNYKKAIEYVQKCIDIAPNNDRYRRNEKKWMQYL